MITRYYQFAGIKLEISMPEELSLEKENYLAPFRKEILEADIFLRFEKVEELLPPVGELICSQVPLMVYRGDKGTIRYLDVYEKDWKKATVRTEFRDNHAFIQLQEHKFPERITERYLLESMGVEHLAVQNDGFVFHCAYIDHNGKAILFTAPSETGKTTQAELWNRLRGAGIINGDKAVVRLKDGILEANGIPFTGSSRYCENRNLPIEAIVYLDQAPQTSIRRMAGYKAFIKIWEGIAVSAWEPEDAKYISGIVQRIVEQIPVYFMPCTPDESAVIVLEETLRKQVKE